MQLLFTLLFHHLDGASQRGQSTVEYILVTLAAAMLAGILIKFLGGATRLLEVFNKVVDSILGLF